jgi:predicted ester cyclase
MPEDLSPSAVLGALAECHRAGDVEAALHYIAEESLDQGKRATRDDWKRKWAQMWAGCPDVVVTVEHTVEDGEWASNRYSLRGTHSGELFGRPPTGKRIDIAGMDMIRVRGGQIVEHWGFTESF